MESLRGILFHILSSATLFIGPFLVDWIYVDVDWLVPPRYLYPPTVARMRHTAAHGGYHVRLVETDCGLECTFDVFIDAAAF